MRPLLIGILLALCACERPTPLTEADWTNGQQPCGENRLSFKDRRIGYYPRGKPSLVIFEIEEMTVDPTDSSVTNVVTAPAQLTLDGAKQSGLVLPDDFRAMFRFRVTNDRLSLLDFADADGTNRRTASAEVQNIFDLLQCPK